MLTWSTCILLLYIGERSDGHQSTASNTQLEIPFLQGVGKPCGHRLDLWEVGGGMLRATTCTGGSFFAL